MDGLTIAAILLPWIAVFAPLLPDDHG